MGIKLKTTSTYFESGCLNMGEDVKCKVIKTNELCKYLRELSYSNRSNDNSPQGELVVTFLEDDEVLVEIYNGLRE